MGTFLKDGKEIQIVLSYVTICDCEARFSGVSIFEELAQSNARMGGVGVSAKTSTLWKLAYCALRGADCGIPTRSFEGFINSFQKDELMHLAAMANQALLEFFPQGGDDELLEGDDEPDSADPTSGRNVPGDVGATTTSSGVQPISDSIQGGSPLEPSGACRDSRTKETGEKSE